MVNTQSQMFGGDWRQEKLDILRGYLNAYTRALKNQSFELEYTDAFAGTGYREMRRQEPERGSLFDELTTEETAGLLDGSARISLQVEHPFDVCVFAEKHVLED